MNVATFSLLLTIAGAIVGLISSLSGNRIIAVIATVIAVVGALLQYYISKPFILNFQESDWTQVNNGFILSIPARHHMRRYEIVSKVYQVKDGVSQVVMCGQEEQPDGSFVISTNVKFNGRLVLK